MKNIIFIFLFCIGMNAQDTIVLTDDDIRAFYGAKGHGRNTNGFRQGTPQVLFVTNLNDSGSGSPRVAMETSGPRYVIPRISGTINSTDYDVYEVEGDVYFAGQVAPGGGLAIRGNSLYLGTSANHDDFLIRHFRIRQDPDNSGGVLDQDCIRLDFHDQNNVMLDHLSTSYGIDENIDFDGSNISVTNSIISDNNGSGGVLMQDPTTGVGPVSIYGNLFIWNEGRNVFQNTSENVAVEAINNFVYGYAGEAASFWNCDLDMIGNSYENNTNGVDELRLLDGNQFTTGNESDTNLYFVDNIYEGQEGYYSDWFDTATFPANRTLPSDITPISASATKAYVLENAGAGAGIAQGRDSYDSGLIDDINNQVASNYMNSNFEYPSLASGTPYADADGDGLSDAYETANGGNISPFTRPATATLTNGTIIDQSGVTNYATQGYYHMDIFLSEWAGDWNNEASTQPTCSDGIQNGDETGVDCGGSCDPCSSPPSPANDIKKKKKSSTVIWW